MKANKRDFLDLVNSIAWKDLAELINERLQDVRDELENPQTSHEIDLMNKGRAEELRWSMDLPGEILKVWDQIKKENKDDDDESNN